MTGEREAVGYSLKIAAENLNPFLKKLPERIKAEEAKKADATEKRKKPANKS